MAGKGNPKTGGRKKGVSNVVTTKAREAIALFVDDNAHRLTGWLDKVAEDNPAEAFRLFQSVIEYHIPKLARTESKTEVTGEAPIIKVVFPKHDEPG